MTGIFSIIKGIGLASFFVLAMLFADASDARANDVEILGVNYPPYEIENPEDGRRGFDLEVVEAAFAVVGIKANFGFVPWNRAKMTVEAGRATALLSCSYRPEREEFYLYSNEISGATRGFYANTNYQGPDILAVEDVKRAEFSKYTIGVVHGYTPEKRLKEMGINYDPAPNDVAAIKKLVGGRTDLFLTTKENTEYLLGEMDVTADLKFYELFRTQYHLCIGKKWPEAEELLKQFNRGLRMVHFNGEYDKIHARYR